jgi:hypothetical protein
MEPMSVDLAETVLTIVAGYFAVGALFALAFIPFGLRRVDVVAAGGPLRFKLLIAPGVVAIWPVVLVLWLSGGRERAA